MMITLSVTDVIAFLGYLALLYAGAPLAILASILLLVPACRRITLLRRLGWGVLTLVGLLAVSAVPMLSEIWSEHEQKLAYDRNTHHLKAPQLLSGIVFPAGSMVHVSNYNDDVEFGFVPVPTPIAGLTLIGDFRLERADSSGPYSIVAGSLAVPTPIHGIPCGTGPLLAKDETTRCILDRDYDFNGHLMAHGQGIEIYRSPAERAGGSALGAPWPGWNCSTTSPGLPAPLLAAGSRCHRIRWRMATVPRAR